MDKYFALLIREKMLLKLKSIQADIFNAGVEPEVCYRDGICQGFVLVNEMLADVLKLDGVENFPAISFKHKSLWKTDIDTWRRLYDPDYFKAVNSDV